MNENVSLPLVKVILVGNKTEFVVPLIEQSEFKVNPLGNSVFDVQSDAPAIGAHKLTGCELIKDIVDVIVVQSCVKTPKKENKK